jgi:hypothetical protein
MADFFYNQSAPIGQIIDAATTNTTGDFGLTLVFILLFFVILCFIFRMPMELIAIVIFPFLLVGAAFGIPTMTSLMIFDLIWLGLILARNFFFSD